MSTGPAVTPAQHWGGFVAAGVVALIVDAAVLSGLSDTGLLSPLVARLLSISAAMVVSWQINRRVTFARKGPSTLNEFARFAAVSWSAQAVNYAVFAAILLAWPEVWPVWALIAASLIAMFVSYWGFRYRVFHRPDA